MVGVRILITGITGFVGSHFAEYALAQGTEVIGALRWRSKTEHIEHLRDRISLFESDLRDLLSVRALLEQARPDYIVHLAAQRSEEHTSELQSRLHLVCRLLLEKKKKKYITIGHK